MARSHAKGDGGTPRRSFIKLFGAGALGTSAVIFGPAEAAMAGNYGCCNLAFAPTVSVSSCRSGSNYTWYCQSTPTRGCTCCEVKNSSGQFVKSAYACDNT